MATIMEKDVALEVLSATLALVSRKFNVDRNICFPPVEEELLAVRKHLYGTAHEDVDFDAFNAIVNRCKAIKADYEGVADCSIDWPPCHAAQ